MTLEKLLELSDELDSTGLTTQADLIDQFVESFSKTARAGVHKCGLKTSTVESHEKLLKDYETALSHYKSEYKKALISNNEKDSPNYGKLREIMTNYTHNCNAVMFHKMYFEDTISNNPFALEKDSQMKELLKQYYGNYQDFANEIKRLAKVSRNGWVLFSYCSVKKELDFNVIDLHDQHVMASSLPILALDMWEHAYFQDFGLEKDEYVDWFLDRIDWRNPRKRLKNITRMK